MKFFFKQTYTCIPKSDNDARMQAKLGKKNPTGLPVGVVSDMDYLCAALNASDGIYGNHNPVLGVACEVRDFLYECGNDDGPESVPEKH